MIIKNNKEIGYIYKNNKKIDKIIKNEKILFEQGFTNEEDSSILPLSFSGNGKKLKDYKIYGNTTYDSVLPEGYTQVAYIESNGSQYIDIDFKPDNNTSYILDIKTNTLGGFQYLVSSASTSRSNIYINDSNYISIGYGSYYGATTKKIQSNMRYNIYFNKNLFYVDNELIEECQEETFSNNINCILFARNLNGTIGSYASIKLYSCKIYDNGVIARNLIPCYRNLDNEIGLYDLVNDVFYTNDGTGYFTYGTEFEPTIENPVEIISCGDKTTNLFNKKIATYKNGYLKDDNGNEQTSDISGYLTSYVSVKPNNKYTIQGSLKDFSQSAQAYRLYFYDINKNWLSRTSGITKNPPYTFTTPNNCYFMQFQYRKDTFSVNDIQIEEGEEATVYKPYGYEIPIYINNNNTANIYLDEPLRKTKDNTYCDYIDYAHKKVYRQLSEVTYTDYSSFAGNGTRQTYARFITPVIDNLKLDIADSAESSKYFFSNYVSEIDGTTSTSKIRFAIPHKYLNTIYGSSNPELKAALINKMSNNKIDFVYPLENPVSENIELPNIQTINGNNLFNIETKVTPSKVYIKYKSNE